MDVQTCIAYAYAVHEIGISVLNLTFFFIIFFFNSKTNKSGSVPYDKPSYIQIEFLSLIFLKKKKGLNKKGRLHINLTYGLDFIHLFIFKSKTSSIYLG